MIWGKGIQVELTVTAESLRGEVCLELDKREVEWREERSEGPMVAKSIGVLSHLPRFWLSF